MRTTFKLNSSATVNSVLDSYYLRASLHDVLYMVFKSRVYYMMNVYIKYKLNWQIPKHIRF
jgi:hypothetical protein